MSKNSELEIKNISKKYGDNVVLSNINLKIRKGEFISLLGPSGCGKSTLLKIIAGLELADSGCIMRGQDDFTTIPTGKRNVGMVFQNYALFPNLTVLENIEYGLKAQKKIGKNLIEEKARYWIDKVQLNGKENSYPNELSGGQQQRVAIARALVNKPAILLADEPTGNLDSATTIEVIGLLKTSCRKYNQTILMVTHNEAIAQICDRIIHIEDGMVTSGTHLFPQKGGDGVC